MPSVPHHHECQDCHAKTPCNGQLLDNHGGQNFVICADFHTTPNEAPNHDFVCEGCQWSRDDAKAFATGIAITKAASGASK